MPIIEPSPYVANEIPTKAPAIARTIRISEARQAIEDLRELLIDAGWSLIAGLPARAYARMNPWLSVSDGVVVNPKRIPIFRESFSVNSRRFGFYDANKEDPALSPLTGVTWVQMGSTWADSQANLRTAVTPAGWTSSASAGFTPPSWAYSASASLYGHTFYFTGPTPTAGTLAANNLRFSGTWGVGDAVQDGYRLESQTYRGGKIELAIYVSYAKYVIVAVFAGGYSSGDLGNGAAIGATGTWYAKFLPSSSRRLHVFADPYQFAVKTSDAGEASQYKSPYSQWIQDFSDPCTSLLASVPWRPADDPDTRYVILGGGSLKHQLVWHSAPHLVLPGGVRHFGDDNALGGVLGLRYFNLPVRTLNNAFVLTHAAVFGAEGPAPKESFILGKLWNCAVGHDVMIAPASASVNPKFRDPNTGTVYHQITRQEKGPRSRVPRATLWYAV